MRGCNWVNNFICWLPRPLVSGGLSLALGEQASLYGAERGAFVGVSRPLNFFDSADRLRANLVRWRRPIYIAGIRVRRPQITTLFNIHFL
jgi:hypothetical protein